MALYIYFIAGCIITCGTLEIFTEHMATMIYTMDIIQMITMLMVVIIEIAILITLFIKIEHFEDAESKSKPKEEFR